MAEQSWQQKLDEWRSVLLEAVERFFTENKSLKLVSLGIALLMWFTLSQQGERDRTIENVTVEIINRRSDTMVTAVPIKVVDIRVRGPLSVVTNLSRTNVRVVIDVTAMSPMNHLIWLGAAHVRLPSEAEVLRIDPPNIPVLVESVVRRSVAVKPVFDLEQLPAHLAIAEYQMNPSQVNISGPASEIDPVQHVLTQPITLPPVQTDASLTVSLQQPGPHVTLTPSQINLTIRTDQVAEKQFPQITLPSLPRNLAISATSVTVTLKGPKSLLDKMGPQDMIVKLDATTFSKDGREVSPKVELSERYRELVSVLSVRPEKLMITAR
ncbi:MAG: CdaR family protein [Acidobacteriota bacterium]|nr:CdaR family protein [Blastocatellia bacterium]MDW8240170.1 CdaR family protein [Acidobacteriota bacterium]